MLVIQQVPLVVCSFDYDSGSSLETITCLNLYYSDTFQLINKKKKKFFQIIENKIIIKMIELINKYIIQ